MAFQDHLKVQIGMFFKQNEDRNEVELNMQYNMKDAKKY